MMDEQHPEHEPAALAAEPDETTVPIDADGRLTDDAACRKCGYNLRGLPLDGTCPECQTAVGRSVRGDLLRYCDPGWVDRVAGGARLLLVAVVAALAIGLALLVGFTLMGVLGGVNARPGTLNAWVMVAMVADLAVFALFLLAYWRVTTRDPAQGDEAWRLDARRLARVGLVASIAIDLLGNIGLWTGVGIRGGGMTHPVAQVLVGLVPIAGAVLGVAGMAALFVYGRWLALRLPDDRLARGTRLVMWVTVPAGGVIALSEGSFGVVAGTVPGAMSVIAVLGIAASVARIAALPFWIWAIVLLVGYRRGFRDAARQARATWARPADV